VKCPTCEGGLIRIRPEDGGFPCPFCPAGKRILDAGAHNEGSGGNETPMQED
jgi:hypothetical protein